MTLDGARITDHGSPRRALAAAVLALASCAAIAADGPETGSVATLPAPQPRWVWVNDIVFNHMEAGKTYLLDAGSGRFLGMLSTGMSNIALALPKTGGVIYSPETYLERGTRGRRTDVVTIYDAARLAPVAEVAIPPKRAQSNATLWHNVLTDDDRFLLVYNFTPAQSVTVVDTVARAFVGEIESPGCALVYPSGARRFHMLCGDGSLLTVTLDDAGGEKTKSRSEPFFATDGDFLTEKPVRYRSQYLFASVEGHVQPVDVGGDTPAFGERWPLVEGTDREQNWRIGGIQHFAVHAADGRLYALMHQGGKDSHKDPGTQVWVFDLATRKRVQRIALEEVATAIQVTQDPEPLLLAAFAGKPGLEVYDAGTGKRLRAIPEVGFTPTVLQTPAGP